MTDARMRGNFTVHGTKTARLPPLLPKEICLSHSEMHELVSLTIQEQSAMDFWKRTFRARGIKAPRDRICAMVYMAPDLFQLEWHQKALGPKAIAAGRDYRKFAEQKDREFAARRTQ